MRLSSLVITCLAITATRGSLSDHERINLHFRVLSDFESLDMFMATVAKNPQASGMEILSEFGPEMRERLHRIYTEGPAAIEARLQTLGSGLADYKKDMGFIGTAFGALAYIFFHYQHNLAKSTSPDAEQLTPEMLALVEEFIEHDPYESKYASSSTMRVNHMLRFRPELIHEVCKWFKLGYKGFVSQARQYSPDYDEPTLGGEYHGTPYFKATAIACRAFELTKRREPEYSLSENEAKYPHK